MTQGGPRSWQWNPQPRGRNCMLAVAPTHVHNHGLQRLQRGGEVAARPAVVSTTVIARAVVGLAVFAHNGEPGMGGRELWVGGRFFGGV